MNVKFIEVGKFHLLVLRDQFPLYPASQSTFDNKRSMAIVMCCGQPFAINDESNHRAQPGSYIKVLVEFLQRRYCWTGKIQSR